MVKFALNFCSCAVDQETAVFQGNGSHLQKFHAHFAISCLKTENGPESQTRCGYCKRPSREALGGLGRPGAALEIGLTESFLAAEGTAGPPARGCFRRVPETREQKLLGLGSLPLHLRGRAPSGRHGGGSRPALPGLYDVLCRSRSSGSFGLRVAVVEPSAKTLGFRD